MRRVSEHIDDIVISERLGTVGAALIRDGQLVWTGDFGTESPGVPAGRGFRL